MAKRAKTLASDGELRLAGHLIEMAANAEPDDPEVQAARVEISELRQAAEPSLMAKAIFGAAARDSRKPG